MRTLVFESWGTKYRCTVEMGSYKNGNTYIQLWCADGPCATLTTNISNVKLPGDYAIIDTNNCPSAEKLMKQYKLGEFADRFVCSGYCMYPVYKLDLDAWAKYEWE